MRSVVVVLPASMWAMIPMLRTLARGLVRVAGASAMVFFHCVGGGGGYRYQPPTGRLPAIVGEGLVRLGHLVHVFAALDRGADAVGGVEQFSSQLLGHRLPPPLLGGGDPPADREGGSTGAADLDGDLIGGTADPAALDL